jgi:hypothetical protein
MPTNLLYVPLPILQYYFVDKDSGLPLAAGIVTFYQDENRTILKPVFTITGSPPDYTFTQLPNPLILGSGGTFLDGSGNDIIPYLYPYDVDGNPQLYYITVDNYLGVPQFTREGVPSGIAAAPIASATGTVNYIPNGQFELNVGSIINVPARGVVIASGASHGLINTDIQFYKPVGGQTDSITFTRFSGGPQLVEPDPTPSYYLTYNCSTIVSDSPKYIEFVISNNARMFDSQNLVVTFQARSSNNNTLEAQYVQYMGDNGGSVTTILTHVNTFNLLPGVWTRFSQTFTVPSTVSYPIGTCGNDFNSIRLLIQPGTLVNIDLAVVQLTYGTEAIPFIYEVADVIAGQTTVPRSGDVRMSVRPPDPTWLLMNDGTIGSATSGATTRANIDTFPLYYYIYQNVTNANAPVVGGRGTNVYTDFVANKPITLTKALGRAFSGINPTGASISPLPATADHTTSLFSVSATSGSFLEGDAVYLTSTGALPTGLSGYPTLYYVIYVSNTSFQLATTEENAFNDVVETFSDNGTGTLTVSLANSIVRNLGDFAGQETHTQIIPELAAHNHTTANIPSTRISTTATASSNLSLYETGVTTVFSSTTGTSTPFNIIQPTTFMNFYIKL